MYTDTFCINGGTCATWYYIPTPYFTLRREIISLTPKTQALDPSSTLIGVVICKLEPHRSGTFRGYIAMLAVQETYRGQGIATKLVHMAIEAMKKGGADEIVLETEVTNTASLKLYERLGFLRSKRLHRYYLNGNAAFRLVLYLKAGTALKRSDGGDFGMGGMEFGGMQGEDHGGHQAHAHLQGAGVS